MDSILSIDCCTEWTSIGLLVDGAVRGEVNMNVGRRQSTLLPLFVERLLETFSMTPRDIALFAVTTGPGSFTGIKVGIAFAQFLAWGLARQVVPVSSLESLAFAHRGYPGTTMVLLKAGGGRLFAAGYRGAGEEGPQCVVPSGTYLPEELFLALDERSEARESLRWISPSPRAIAPLFRSGWSPFVQHAIPSGGRTAQLAGIRRESGLAPRELQASYLKEPTIG